MTSPDGTSMEGLTAELDRGGNRVQILFSMPASRSAPSGQSRVAVRQRSTGWLSWAGGLFSLAFLTASIVACPGGSASLLLHAAGPVSPVPPAAPPSFLSAKTLFQTNRAYDPRIALAVDAVIVHRHADRGEQLRSAIGS